MAESTLSVTREDLLRHIGRMLGWSRDPDEWTATETTDGNDVLNSGLRQFYTPQPLPGERTPHRWSFLQPLLPIPLAAGTPDVDLPDLFGGFITNALHYAAGDDTIGAHLRLTGMGEILAARQRDVNTGDYRGQPTMGAVQPLPATGERPQRFALSVWPTPDAAYTLTGQVLLNPFSVTDDKPYPLGGQPHAETLIASCLAAAELFMDDQRGNHYARFIERMAASVAFDREALGTKHFGYNADRSGSGGGSQMVDRHQGQYVLYEGALYAGENA